MISIIHYEDTNSVEVTWRDADGNQTRCHSYADVQMDMLREDLGDSASEHAELIAKVEAGIKPPVPTPEPTIREQIAALEASITDRRYREAILGTDNGWLANVDAQIAALRVKL